MGASLLVGIGFLLFLPFHDTYVQVITNMVIVGWVRAPSSPRCPRRRHPLLPPRRPASRPASRTR